MPWILVRGFFGATAVTWTSQCECPLLQQCTSAVKRLHWRLITFRTRCYYLKDQMFLHLGQILHLGLQQMRQFSSPKMAFWSLMGFWRFFCVVTIGSEVWKSNSPKRLNCSIKRAIAHSTTLSWFAKLKIFLVCLTFSRSWESGCTLNFFNLHARAGVLDLRFIMWTREGKRRGEWWHWHPLLSIFT